MDIDEFEKTIVDPICEKSSDDTDEDLNRKEKLRNDLMFAFDNVDRTCMVSSMMYTPRVCHDVVVNTDTTNPVTKYTRIFTGLEFDVSKFHVNSYYNIKSEHINFTNAKLGSVCYGELIFIVNEDNTVKHITITPKIVGKNDIIFEEVN
jgi:hypothetical protein